MPTPFPDISSIGTPQAVGAAIGRHLDASFRLLTGPATQRTPGYFRLITGEPHPIGNFAVLAEADDVAQARAGVEPLVAGGAPAAVMLPGLTCSAEVHAYLTGHGFVPEPPMPAMAVEIATLAPTTLPDGYQLMRLNHGPEAGGWTEALAAGYGLPPGVARVMSPETLDVSPSPDAPMQFFGVRAAGRIVGTSMLAMHSGLAGVYCVATLPEERGKGIGAHATAAVLRLAASLGYRVGVLQSSEAGHPIYRRLGFADYGGVPLYIRMPQ